MGSASSAALILFLTARAALAVDESSTFAPFLEAAGIKPEASAVSARDEAPVRIVSARQDFKQITFNQSCHLLTPIQIGEQHFAKGLGMHANGNAVFALNGKFTRFTAQVGVDNNPDTAGRGTVTFAVKVDGKEVAHTGVLKGKDAPVSMDVPLNGAKQLELIVGDAGDGFAYDQADWGNAVLTDAAGHRVYLSDTSNTQALGAVFAPQVLPSSFTYGGQSSGVLLQSWQREEKPPVVQADRIIHSVTWKEPGTGFSATWRATVFKDRPALEFQWSFVNDGSAPAKPLTNVLALDLPALHPGDGFKVLSSSGGLDGSLTGGRLGFELSSTTNTNVTLHGEGGRSSDRDLPFFLLQAPQASQGVYVGVGWSGDWQAQTVMGQDHQVSVQVGMPGMNLSLPPGEHIVSPSILLGSFTGEASAGSNALRRILYDKYVPLLDGKKPLPPVSWNHWFILQNGISEDILKKQADYAAAAGMEYFCIDSGGFDGDFPDGVGNWTVSATKFPHGIGAVGDYVDKKGMRLGLWFEPERAAANTKITKDHPDWIHGNLVDFGNKDARDWCFNLIKQHYDEDHVRWIRWDFNTSPASVWNSMDAPDQKGLAQIRHVMGLYEVLDRLMAACPDLLIEGCASGGRRIDLETVKRSHTFWKSDETGDIPTMRFHETGANTFLPSVLLNTNVLPESGGRLRFDIASIFGGPLGFQCNWPQMTDTDRAALAKMVATYKKLRPLLQADYYSLFKQQRGLETWTGWQFNDPEKGEGFIVVLRPPASPYDSATAQLKGLDSAASYKMMLVAGNSGEKVPTGNPVSAGEVLANDWSVKLEPQSFAIYRYEKVK